MWVNQKECKTKIVNPTNLVASGEGQLGAGGGVRVGRVGGDAACGRPHPEAVGVSQSAEPPSDSDVLSHVRCLLHVHIVKHVMLQAGWGKSL